MDAHKKNILIFSFQALEEKAKSITGVIQWPYKAVAKAVEIIPKTLIQNCGVNSIRTLTALRVSMSGIYLFRFWSISKGFLSFFYIFHIFFILFVVFNRFPTEMEAYFWFFILATNCIVYKR